LISTRAMFLEGNEAQSSPAGTSWFHFAFPPLKAAGYYHPSRVAGLQQRRAFYFEWPLLKKKLIKARMRSCIWISFGCADCQFPAAKCPFAPPILTCSIPQVPFRSSNSS